MSDNDILTPPPTAGLPQNGTPQPDAEPRTGRGLIDAAAAGDTLSQPESDDLLAYYLTNESLPGDDDIVELEVKLGNGAKARRFRCSVHTIEWSEWQDAQERATNDKNELDSYVMSSWIVARALVTPKLGPTVLKLQSESEDAPSDSADLLRRMFKSQSGALLELSAKVLTISKLQGDNGTIREVEAAKA